MGPLCTVLCWVLAIIALRGSSAFRIGTRSAASKPLSQRKIGEQRLDFSSTLHRLERNEPSKLILTSSSDDENDIELHFEPETGAGLTRRQVISSSVASFGLLFAQDQALAAGFFEAVLKKRSTGTGFLFNPNSEVKPLEPYVSLLPQSALLYLLPVNSRPLRQLQKQIERTNAIRAAYTLQGNVTSIPDGTFTTIEQSSKAALATLRGFRGELMPAFAEGAAAETQIKRNEDFEAAYACLETQLLRMGEGAQTRDIGGLLRAQEEALLALGFIGDGLVAEFPFEVPVKKKWATVPRLEGRAWVDIAMERPSAGKTPEERALGNVSVIAAGYSSPITAGNWVDLCYRGFYDDLELTWKNVTAKTANNLYDYEVPVGGTYRDGFVDPLTGKVRRVPLEILRYSAAAQQQVPQYGSYNSRLFTRDPVIQSFKVLGAVGMYHTPGDNNGASSEFFFLPNLLHRDKFVDRLDESYSILGYVVAGQEVVNDLRPGDKIRRAYVRPDGMANLRKIKPNFLKTLIDTFSED